MLDQERFPPCRDGRVDDRLESGEFPRIAEYQCPELVSRNAVFVCASGKGLLDGRDQCAPRPLHGADLRVGIEHRNTRRFEHGGDGRLAHADGPGEADNEGTGHVNSLSRSSAS